MAEEQIELMGPAEAAEACGFSTSRLYVLRSEGRFPKPDWVLARGPVWRAEVIREWRRTWDSTPGRKSSG